MPHYSSQDDSFDGDLHFSPSPRKSPSRHAQSALNNRRSSASLRGGSSFVHPHEQDAANGRHHSLAHELAFAMMPEPTPGASLAEEFGIEYDEGAEGIDSIDHDAMDPNHAGPEIIVDDPTASSLAEQLHTDELDTSFSPHSGYLPSELDHVFGSSAVQSQQRDHKEPEQDAMEVLAQNLQSTDHFLAHLRKIDSEATPSSQQPTLERVASDVIRRMNDTVKDREGQVRELLEYEREFRKIAGEIGGSDVLAHLDELPALDDDLSDTTSSFRPQLSRADTRELDPVQEEPSSNDWELDPDSHNLGDDEYDEELVVSPIKDFFPPPPLMQGPPTPANTIPQLAHLRTCTTSLVTSLSTISEHAQVNGAATTEAGRKIRALKNKLGGWRTDWESAERSRIKIERWESGVLDGSDDTPPARLVASKQVDDKPIKKITDEHLHAFELALADAALKTQAIMAR